VAVYPHDTLIEFSQPGNPSKREFYWDRNGVRTSGNDRKLPQPYKMLWARSDMTHVGSTANFWGDAPNTHTARFVQDEDVNDPGTYAQAYGRWIGEARTSAQVGATIVEGEQALAMIANRAFQLKEMFLALKRGRFGDFAAHAGLDRISRRKRRTRPGQAAGLWLEYHFGWEPLVKDIYDAVNIIQGPLPSKLVKATAQNAGEYRIGSAFPATSARQVISWQTSWRLQGRLECTNPNLGVASQMGLINPLSLLWEVTPFSFVVDWFYPVGNFLDNLTNLVGYSQIECQSAHRRKATGFERVAFPEIPGLDIGTEQKNSAYSFQRVIGEFPMPSLASKPFKGVSVVRAATAISLLVSVLNTGLRDLPSRGFRA
jgi:hypothetical protein